MKQEQKGRAKLQKDEILSAAMERKEQLKAAGKRKKEAIQSVAMQEKEQLKKAGKRKKEAIQEGARKPLQPNMKENLKKATTEMLVLLMLREKSMYAYEMIQYIAEVTNNVITFNTLYIAIYRLRDRGLLIEQEKVLTEGNRTRVYFAITPEGQCYLAQSIAEYHLVTNAIAALL